MAEHLAAALAAATAAAETATQALAEVRRAQVQGLATKPKELELSGRPEEDRRLWADWRFAMTHYLGSKDQQYTSEIKAALERQCAGDEHTDSRDPSKIQTAVYVSLWECPWKTSHNAEGPCAGLNQKWL